MVSVEIQSLIDIQENPVVLVDTSYRIAAANWAYCDAYGVHPDQVVGMACHEVSHHSPVPCHQAGESCPYQQVLESGQPQQVLHTHFDALNRPEHVRIKGYPIQTSGGHTYVAEVIYRIASSSDVECEEVRMLGRSPAFLECLDKLTRVAESESSILLYGESGVGKELAAQYIHKRSSRRAMPFLAVNCASIPESLFESELFGHEKGAFTGCLGRKQGLFELSDGGTLFLDEIGEIPLAMQAKLLRVLESGEFRRVGGKETLHADVRILSATNRDLLELADQGAFRQDLYYRVAGIDVTLPSLRERRMDIRALAEMFLKRTAADSKRHYRFTEAALIRLGEYDFPGNVRELRNIVQKAAAMSVDGIIMPQHLYLESPSQRAPGFERAQRATETIVSSASMAEVEAKHIAELLRLYTGHRRKAADAMGISERTLYRKIKQYGLC
ncbi:MAG: sigma-54 interaction domain-containing protein [Burkholderiales bacterium]